MPFEPLRQKMVLWGLLCGVLVCIGMHELMTRDAAAQDDDRLRRPLRGNSLKRVLDRESEFDLTGHPASWGALVTYLELRGYRDLGLGIPIEIDQFALSKQGVDLDNLGPYWVLHAGGVSRRSSLRFIFDAGGVSYYIDGQRLIVTTKQVARQDGCCN